MKTKRLHIKVSLLLILGVILCVFINLVILLRILRIDSNESPVVVYEVQEKNTNDNIRVWIAGIQRDASLIESRNLIILLELNCLHNVGIHILTRENAAFLQNKYQEMKGTFLFNFTFNETIEHKKCAPFLIQDEDTINDSRAMQLHKIENRIDRISILRDIQRDVLHQEFLRNSLNKDNDGVIIIADLDLWKISTTDRIMENVNILLESFPIVPSSTRHTLTFPHDAICGNGMTLKPPRVKGDPPLRLYYDTFATVFLPDTFSFPIHERYFEESYPGEDTNFIRSHNSNGKVNQMYFHNLFFEKGRESETGIVRVRSCFGGIGIYRASVYFETNCQYSLREDVEQLKSDHYSIMRYANKEERPCEHVVFHDCLRQYVNGFDIGVDPYMIPFWKQNDLING